MASSEYHNIDGPITCQIFSDGQEIEFLHMLISVETAVSFGRLPTAEVVFQDSIDNLEICESDQLQIGSEMEIKMGREDDLSCIFRGVVCSRGLKYGKSGAEVVVTAKHKAFRMTHALSFRIFEDMTDADIIKQICADHAVDADVDDTPVPHEHLMQYNCSDWDFINMRAESAGLLLSATPDGIKVAKPDPGVRKYGELTAVYHSAQTRGTDNDTVYIYDMGLNMVGVPKITFPKGEAGRKITIRYAEILYPHLDPKNPYYYGDLGGLILAEGCSFRREGKRCGK